MKFRYILGVLLSAFLLMGCSDDDTKVGKLADLQLDKTFLSIPVTGGSVSVVVTATSDWKFDNAFWHVKTAVFGQSLDNGLFEIGHGGLTIGAVILHKNV